MYPQRRSNDAIHWYMAELSSRVVAESGRPSDRQHVGKLILQSLKDAPDFISQIDGATGESETNHSVLKRTVRCATAFKNMGLNIGDVVITMAPNHIDLCVPVYAALYNGIAVAAIDRYLTIDELQLTFDVDGPKVIFCQSDKATDVQLALNRIGLNALIVAFDEGDYLCSFQKFLLKYADDTTVEEFKAADFDPEETTAYLIATSGTTGVSKAAVVTHKNIAIMNPYIWGRFTNFPTPTRIALIASPLQWLSAIVNYNLSPILRYTRLQTSMNVTQEHAYALINTYKPTFTILSPTMMITLLKPGDRDQCDFSCLEIIWLGGSAVPAGLIEEIKKMITRNAEVTDIYGMTELSGMAFAQDDPLPGSCGKPLACFQYRLIDVESQNDIAEPNTPGELWIKGPGVFKEYYNNSSATKDTFQDGWFKTGDMFYRDERMNFFFVERIKLLLKYKSYHVSPVELETVIRQHPGVLDVAVAGLSDPECGEVPVACVVRQPDYSPPVSAQLIKDLVTNSLTDSKKLRGGVIFLKEIPVTASTKVHRRKLKEIVVEMERE